MDLEGHYPQNSISLCIILNETQITLHFFQGRISAMPEIRTDLFLATLSQRRQQHKLSFMYNVNTGMVPPYIQDLIPPLVSEVSDYPLRNTGDITVPYNRTSILQKSCIPSSIRLWNSLADDLKDSSSLLTFKKHIISNFNISCVPPYYILKRKRNATVFYPLFLPHGSHEVNFLMIFCAPAHWVMICRKMVLLTISIMTLY